MATELEVLQALAAETGLLGPQATAEDAKQSAYAFTVKAAQRLRDRGWALLRAPAGGENVNGVRYDKIINRQTLMVVDIIVSSDDAHVTRVPSWEEKGIGSPGDVVEPPVENGGGGGGGNGGGGGGTGPDEEWFEQLLEDVGNLVGATTAMAEALVTVAKELSALRKDGVKIRL
jgi:hypothetical protein